MLLQNLGLLALAASVLASPMPNGNKNVDGTSTRSDWVSKYKPGNKNVDDTSTRSDWVSKYKPGNKNVDDTSTRSDWVSKYKPGNKNVDDTSTRSDWVSKYKPGSVDIDSIDHVTIEEWFPSGPDYLKLDYSPVHHEHLITLASGTKMMHGDGLIGFMGAVARFLHL